MSTDGRRQDVHAMGRQGEEKCGYSITRTQIVSITLHHDYSMAWQLAAAENLLVFGADVSNASGEAPAPKQGFNIHPDKAFIEWWNARGRSPIQPGQAIPVQRAMQGYPEASRLWEKHMIALSRNTDSRRPHTNRAYAGEVDGERYYVVIA